jgi:hypothetical protein
VSGVKIEKIKLKDLNLWYNFSDKYTIQNGPIDEDWFREFLNEFSGSDKTEY